MSDDTKRLHLSITGNETDILCALKAKDLACALWHLQEKAIRYAKDTDDHTMRIEICDALDRYNIILEDVIE